MSHIHINLLQRTSHLLARKASPVPAQHIVDPSSHGLMAITDDFAAFGFILQPSGNMKEQLHLCSALSSLSLVIYPKDALGSSAKQNKNSTLADNVLIIILENKETTFLRLAFLATQQNVLLGRKNGCGKSSHT